MRATVLSLVVSLLHIPLALAFEIEQQVRFGPDGDGPVLRIISTADIAFFEPMMRSYLAQEQDTAIEYTVVSSAELMRAIGEENAPFDVAISSAMDLQTKLANDGFALSHVSSATQSMPDWAIWNDMLFAFTQEPATFVVARGVFPNSTPPDTRQALIDLLRRDPETFRGRIGTYDIRQSGLGYLFATQDTRASDTLWRLTEVLGSLDAKLYCCSSEMIDAVKSGELLIAINVLGSYVASRQDRDAFEIILPSDFTTVMLRTALIPVNAPSPHLSRDFLDHLIRRSFGPDAEPLVRPTFAQTALNRIQLGPGLLVFLDQLKKKSFLNEWESAIRQNP